MRIAIIGAGRVGKTLGEGFTRAGHTVSYATRDSVAQTVRGAEVAVLTTPWDAVDSALDAAGDFGGRPLIDVTNPIGAGFALALGHTTSGGEHVAARAKGARVVKAFNTTGMENMANPRYGEHRLMMPVAGDDPQAVEVGVELARGLGFAPVALPKLARARELEPFALVWIKLAMQWGQGRDIGFALARRDAAAARPTDVSARGPRRTIAIVGAGHIGGALARGWLAAGHRVQIATRDPQAADVAALVGRGATAVPIAGAAERADVVAFAIPAGAVIETARAMGNLAGKIVIDCTNAIAKGFALQYGLATSASEELAKALPGARVVRSFNQQGAEVLDDPVFGGLRAVDLVAADDAEARAAVVALGKDLGLDAIEAGPLASSRLLDPITLLWVALSQTLGTRDFALTLLRRH
ncbi:MAG TPA: NAD(P)-binding domain-containing protein [Kofleriaceae bacterium]|nr:NAD(P)-binding domain-containing protein [Kofleriaceae bacterium]